MKTSGSVAVFQVQRSGQYRGCSAYGDLRELLDKEKDLDAVVVCTTDNLHAAVSAAAMKKRKHVFCQKPLTHTVDEARRLAEIARETGVVTQIAVSNQASEATHLLCEWIWDGAIGRVREVANWSSRPFWPQGLERPKGAEARALQRDLPVGLDRPLQFPARGDMLPVKFTRMTVVSSRRARKNWRTTVRQRGTAKKRMKASFSSETAAKFSARSMAGVQSLFQRPRCKATNNHQKLCLGHGATNANGSMHAREAKLSPGGILNSRAWSRRPCS